MSMPGRTDSTQAPVDLDQQGMCNVVLYVMSSGRLSRNGEPKEYRRAICFREAIMYRRPTLKVSANTLDAPRCWSLLARASRLEPGPAQHLNLQQATMLVMLSNCLARAVSIGGKPLAQDQVENRCGAGAFIVKMASRTSKTARNSLFAGKLAGDRCDPHSAAGRIARHP
jgi:hypothetical protein